MVSLGLLKSKILFVHYSVAKTKTEGDICPQVQVNGATTVILLPVSFSAEATSVGREGTNISRFHLALLVVPLIIIRRSGVGAKI